MKIKYILSAIAIVAFAQNTHAQYYQDALRFSTFQPGATSRIRAIGNASTAVGGDLSNIGNNPAGLGFFHQIGNEHYPGIQCIESKRQLFWHQNRRQQKQPEPEQCGRCILFKDKYPSRLSIKIPDG